jgi:CRP/FNR family cyclic AMP-dependent transcriptional regulator
MSSRFQAVTISPAQRRMREKKSRSVSLQLLLEPVCDREHKPNLVCDLLLAETVSNLCTLQEAPVNAFSTRQVRSTYHLPDKPMRHGIFSDKARRVTNPEPPAAITKVRRNMAALGLPERLADELLEHHSELTYAKGSIIFHRGAPAELLFWVYRGFVDIILPGDTGGDQVITRLVGPGEIFGYNDYVDDEGRRVLAFEAQARTNCQLGMVTRERVFQLLRSCEKEDLLNLLVNLNSVLSQRIRESIEFVGMNYRQRLEAVLKDFASRFGIEDADGVTLIPEFAQEDFTKIIGCSRPMVNRMLAEMSLEGLIAHSGKRYTLLNNKNHSQAS